MVIRGDAERDSFPSENSSSRRVFLCSLRCRHNDFKLIEKYKTIALHIVQPNAPTFCWSFLLLSSSVVQRQIININVTHFLKAMNSRFMILGVRRMKKFVSLPDKWRRFWHWHHECATRGQREHNFSVVDNNFDVFMVDNILRVVHRNRMDIN